MDSKLLNRSNLLSGSKQVLSFLPFLLLWCGLPSSVSAQSKKEKQDWVTLFNGKDLTGWDIKISGHPLNENYKNTFQVEKGMLRIRYDAYQNFEEKYGHLYYKTAYSHYRIRFQYRFTGKQTPGGAEWNVRNSGIMLHSQSAESLDFHQTFPMSLEMQLLGGLGTGERQTGNLCSPGTQAFMQGALNPAHCINSNSKTYDGDQWVSAEAIVLGDSIVHHVIEGDTVLTYMKTQIGGGFVNPDDWELAKMEPQTIAHWKSLDGSPLTSGYIALQAESHPIDFRNIQLLNLVGCMDPKAKNYKSYYLKSDPTACRFN